jgi:hypothetical protein
MLTMINPVRRVEPFDHPEWLFEPKSDGFRATADTVDLAQWQPDAAVRGGT